MVRSLVHGATVVLFCAFAALGYAQQSLSNPVPVGTVEATKKPVSPTANFVGRVQAINRVDIVARVTGHLDAVLFTEGDVVTEGQLLYRMERDQFQAAVDEADGALAASKAKKLLTAIQYARAEDLTKTRAATVVARDQALTDDRAQDAQILIDQANLKAPKSIWAVPTLLRRLPTGSAVPISRKAMWSAHKPASTRLTFCFRWSADPYSTREERYAEQKTAALSPTRGFALIAWPASYGASAIMSSIVNQDGVVFQKDLGPQTASIAPGTKFYDPDFSWARVDIVN